MVKQIGNLKLYDLDELSELLGVSVRSLRAFMRQGQIKGRKFGRRWYVTEEALREYFSLPVDEPQPEPSTSDNAENRK